MSKLAFWSLRPKLQLRIGTKLAVSAGIGVVLVAGMLVNEQFTSRSVIRQSETANNEQLAAMEVLHAGMALERMQIEIRESRLSVSEREVNEALARLLARAAEAVQALEAAAQHSAHAQIRDGVKELGALIDQYTAAAKDMAAAQKDYGDTDKPLRRAAKIGTEIGAVIEKVSATAMEQTRTAQAAATATMVFADRLGLAAGIAVLSILIGSTVFGVVSIAKPVRRIGEVMLELAKGNKAIEIPYTARTDEVGDNARAAQIFRDNLRRVEEMEAEKREAELRASAERKAAEEREAARQRAADELTAAERKAGMRKLADNFQAAIGNVIRTVSSASIELKTAATTLSKTAENTQQLSAVVAGASEEATANVQSVASATEEMSASIIEISRQVEESSRIAGDAVRQAETTDARITELSEAASRIGDVVKLITAIAEQTNLLALNATIEAARAGDAGKGFAVVAQEVKALAGQTAKATGEISAQISRMQASTQESVAAIKGIGDTIRRISEAAATIAAAVNQQGAATRDISRNVQQAAEGAARVAANITEVNRGAGDTGSASAQVLAAAQALANDSSQLQREVDSFLRRIRSDLTMNFDDAIRAHGEWTDKLALYVRSPDQSLDYELVSRDDQCALGKWIHGEGSCHADLSEFRIMTEAHARFHRAAGDIVRRADRGERVKVETDLAGQSPFGRASEEVIRALAALKNAAA